MAGQQPTHRPHPKTDERWRPVPGWETLYDVSDQGRVRSLPRKQARGRVLAGYVGKVGYQMVTLKHLDRTRYAYVHELVAEVFHGPRPSGMHIRHLDGDNQNNRLSNLVYGSISENTQDTVQHGRHNNARKTHCKWGHSLTDPANLRPSKKQRACRTCANAWKRAKRIRLALEAAGVPQ